MLFKFELDEIVDVGKIFYQLTCLFLQLGNIILQFEHLLGFSLPPLDDSSLSDLPRYVRLSFQVVLSLHVKLLRNLIMFINLISFSGTIENTLDARTFPRFFAVKRTVRVIIRFLNTLL